MNTNSYTLLWVKLVSISLTWTHKIDRGAHVFWLRKGTLDTRPDHIINQIHYEVR
jgi:hypothetical protein